MLNEECQLALWNDGMMEILANTKTQLLKDIFTIAFYTGMRLGELLNL
jgi:integrase